MAKRMELQIDIKANASQAMQSIKALQSSFQGTGGGFGKTLQSDIKTMSDSIRTMQNMANQPIRSQGDWTKLNNQLSKAEINLADIQSQMKQISQLSDRQKIEVVSPDTAANLRKAEVAIEAYTKAEEEEFKSHANVKKALTEQAKAQKDLENAQRATENKKNEFDTKAQKAQQYEAALNELRAAYTAYRDATTDDQKNKARDRLNQAGGAMSAITGGRNTLNANNINEDTFNQLNAGLARSQQEANNAENAYNNLVTSLTPLQERANAAAKALEEAQNAARAQDLEGILAPLRALGADTSNIKTLEQANEALRQIEQTHLNNANNELNNWNNNINTADSAIQALRTQMEGYKKELDQINKAEQNSQNIARRIEYLGSLTAMYRTVTRVMRETYNTVKELDAAMAETAVVTSYSIDDMWSTLSDYTKNANELGVAIADVYESSTLYYQQGLKTSEVNQLTTSTLKMARIAGLDAADATDRMTNALRGFNMALNETNAENVSDVYSKLAAMSASNVDEISTAMTKVASLANSANMSFENTAAFLSQIIETTRESAETAGTALKTVVARFAEVKTAPDTTVEVDGEAASYNKIDTALRSVGISLDAFMKGQEGLDEVLMKLAAKWDTLSTSTQRYIATQAAGSRQQSRFIALMSDYARTQELVTAANNAVGASAEQYAKTLDSLETKLQQLSNAWDTFTTGIMDQAAIKTGVDLLTSLINAINNFNDNISKNMGDTASSLMSVLEGFALLGTVSIILKGVAGAIASLTTETGLLAGFFGGLTNGFKSLIPLMGKSTAATIKKAMAERSASLSAAALALAAENEAAAEEADAAAKAQNLIITKALVKGTMLLVAKIALVVAALYLIIEIYKQIQANSIEGRLKSAQENLSALTDAANNATDALNTLQDTFDNFDDTRREINELAVGTDEWRAKVLELNSEVVNLANSYGKLAEVKYDSNGVAYLEETTQSDINTIAQQNALKANAAKTQQQVIVNDLQIEKSIEDAFGDFDKEDQESIGDITDFKKLVNEIVASNGDISQINTNLSDINEDVIESAQSLATNVIANSESSKTNTEALLTLNHTLQDDLPDNANTQFIVGYEALAQQNYVNNWEGYIKDIWDNDKLKEMVSGVYEGVTDVKRSAWDWHNIKYKTEDSDEWQTVNVESLIKQYLAADFLENGDLETIDAQALQKQYEIEGRLSGIQGNDRVSQDAAQVLIDSIVGEIGDILTGSGEISFSDLGLTKDTYDLIKDTTLGSIETAFGESVNLDEAGFNNIKEAGAEASELVAGITFSVDEDINEQMAEQVWNSIYAGAYGALSSGKTSAIASDYDFSNLSAVALKAIIEGTASDAAKNSTANAAYNAATNALEDLREKNKTANENFRMGSYATEFEENEPEDLANQSKFYLDAAKDIAKFDKELTKANGEMEDGAEIVYKYAGQLERVATYGDDYADAVEDYTDALSTGSIADENAALEKMQTNLTKILNKTVTQEDILDIDQDVLKNSTKSVENFANLLDLLQKKAWEDSTVLGTDLANALIAVGSGYNRVAGEIVTDSAIIDGFNTLVKQTDLTLEDLQKQLGESYTLVINTKGDITGIKATGNTGLSGITTAGTQTKSTSKWDNPLEAQYSLLQKINKEQRSLTALENEYTLATQLASGYTADIAENLQKQKTSLNTQLTEQEELLQGYYDMAEEFNTKYAKRSDYAKWDATTKTFIVNDAAWEAKDQKITTDSQLAKDLDAMEELMSEINSGIEGAEDDIADIKQTYADKRTEAYESYWDLIEETITMLVEQEQNEIDILQEQLDNEKEANEKLLSSIRSNFTQLRQDRENEETEDDIKDLTKKIAYLKQDTSGSNALKIKQLEKELETKTQDYSDSLIDQNLDALEDQNEMMAEQLQATIDNRQSILDWKEEYNKFETQAIEIVKNLKNQLAQGQEVKNTEWGELFSKTHTSITTGDMWSKTNDVETAITEIKTWLPELFEDPTVNLDTYTNELTGNETEEENKNETVSYSTGSGSDTGNGVSAAEIKAVQQWMINTFGANAVGESGADGSWGTDSIAGAKKYLGSLAQNGTYAEAKDAMETYQTLVSQIQTKYSAITTLNNAVVSLKKQIDEKEEQMKNADSGHEQKYATELENLSKQLTKKEESLAAAKLEYSNLVAKRKSLFGFETGGLANFTGPAWLDGTTSNPELVLNAQDTKNFIQLKDILRGLMNGNYNSTSNTGDFAFDIDINVDEIASDYDVDSLATRIKQDIVSAMTYRNNNFTSISR